jgi:16S rRNA C967 or C1407 C5-methylase (RsmB/RsmF family)
MLPVSLVNINEDDIILDCCAAPGSKTLQLMENCYYDAQNKNTIPRGVIWANDADDKRARMLIHLIQNHPTLNLVVTKCDATYIPMNKNLQPDVIICDVPCSGDGTIRKNKLIKKDWDLRHSYNKHDLQKSILENCINICKVGGTIVYSTCAINPIENEAVIASVVEKYKDHVEILDVSDKMKKNNIKYKQGLTRWKVYLDSKLQVSCGLFSDIQNIKEDLKNKKLSFNFKTQVSESMFHPIYTSKNYNSSILHVRII